MKWQNRRMPLETKETRTVVIERLQRRHEAEEEDECRFGARIAE